MRCSNLFSRSFRITITLRCLNFAGRLTRVTGGLCSGVLKAVEACAHLLKYLSIKGYENVFGVIDVGMIAKKTELEHMEIDIL